jgi:glucokinase-like ROK family protein
MLPKKKNTGLLLSTFFWTIPALNIKNLNRHAILDFIRFTPGGIARVDLARHLGLTRAAVTEIVNDLMEIMVVREMNNQKPGGRKPVVLEVNPDFGKVVGVDMGATHVTFILADSSAHVIKEIEYALDINQGPEICLKQVDTNYNQLLADSGLTKSDILAVGFGVPGPVVTEIGMVDAPPIMPGWSRFPIRDFLQKNWGVQVSVNNDAELGALGEWAYGAGRGEHNLCYLKVGTGVGAGILLEGQIYRGTTGTAGEIGHMTIDENGPLCSCGNKGCLEAFTGGRAIAQKAMEAVRAGQRTDLANIKPVENITIKDVVAAARRGDLISQQLFKESGIHLGTAIAGMVNLFNPSMVVVGGGVAQIGDLLLDPIRNTVRQRSLRVASGAVRITSALLGRQSSGIGAVVQANSIILHQQIKQ